MSDHHDLDAVEKRLTADLNDANRQLERAQGLVARLTDELSRLRHERLGIEATIEQGTPKDICECGALIRFVKTPGGSGRWSHYRWVPSRQCPTGPRPATAAVSKWSAPAVHVAMMCACGDRLENLSAPGAPAYWIHTDTVDTPCTEARPVLKPGKES